MGDIGKIPTLNKGFVQLRACAPSYLELEKLKSELYRGTLTPQLIDMVYVVLNMKCPYFMLIPLVSSGIRAAARPGGAADAYCPGPEWIKSGKHATDVEVSESISQTVESLMLNQQAYVKDGCNSFVASITTPVAAYWDGVTMGFMRDWIRFATAPGLHPMIKQYQNAVSNALAVEYTNINDIIRMISR